MIQLLFHLRTNVRREIKKIERLKSYLDKEIDNGPENRAQLSIARMERTRDRWQSWYDGLQELISANKG